MKDVVDKYCIINGSGDLGMDSVMRGMIGKIVYVIRRCKKGLYELSYQSKLYYLPKYNLTVLEINNSDADYITSLLSKEITKQNSHIIDEMFGTGRDDIIEWRYKHIQYIIELFMKVHNRRVKE